MSKYKVVISDLRFADTQIEEEILGKIDAELCVYNCSTEQEMIEKCADADGILLNLAPCGVGVIDKLKKCKVISRYGVGYDNVDVKACMSHGIVLANVPDYCAEDVSDMAMALMLSCARRLSYKDRMIRRGMWNINEEHMMRISGKTVALIGFGRIARTMLNKLKGFKVAKVYVYDPYISADEIKRAGAIKVDLDFALENADFISLHLPLTEQTRGIIGEKEINKMKPSAILINTSRGGLVCEEALVHALQKKRIAGAGLDTLCVEPPRFDHPLFNLDNCVLSDHSGFNTEEAVVDLRKKATWNIVEILEGHYCRYAVNSQ